MGTPNRPYSKGIPPNLFNIGPHPRLSPPFTHNKNVEA